MNISVTYHPAEIGYKKSLESRICDCLEKSQYWCEKKSLTMEGNALGDQVAACDHHGNNGNDKDCEEQESVTPYWTVKMTKWKRKSQRLYLSTQGIYGKA